jgi:copper(I)-binding protein
MDLSGVAGEQVFHTHLNVGDAQVRLVGTSSDITVRVKLEKILTGGAR